MEKLVEVLTEAQKNNEYTDQKMAEKIGLSRSYYNLLNPISAAIFLSV